MKTTKLFRLLLATLFAALLTGSLAAPSHAAGATVLRVPLSGTISSTAGPLSLSGLVHIVIPGNPIVPGNPIRVETNLIQLRAFNATASCSATGSQQFTLATPTTPFTGSYAFIPGNPIAPVDPCRDLAPLSVDYQLTVTEGGEVTGATAVPHTTF
jgi:hypothetical protein